MAALDVTVERVIRRPVAEVAAYSGDPSHAPDWYAGSGTTLMRLRNDGEPSGFSRVAAPVMATAVRRATTKDLAALARILES